jgi:four helix bundle protein
MTTPKKQLSEKIESPAVFRTFENLEVYQQSRAFRIEIYKIARLLPDFEKFGLANQMRRAAVSLTSNIAEGHGRYHFPDQIKFLLNSRGSLEELIDQLNVCVDESYLQKSEADGLKDKAWNVHSILNGYIRYLRGRIEHSSRVQEFPSDLEA